MAMAKKASALTATPPIDTPSSGKMTSLNRMAKTRLPPVMYAEFAQSYIAHPKMVRESLRTVVIVSRN